MGKTQISNPGPVTGGTVRELSSTTFDEAVGASDVPVVVEFWAEWCPPCAAMAPVLAGVAEECRGSLQVMKVNVDDHPDLAARFEVASIPTFVVFTGGAARGRVVGRRSRRLFLAALEDLVS